MKKNSKKMIAPIVVTVLFIVYYVLYFGVLMWAIGGLWRWLLGLLPLAFTAVTLAVCIERIKEIKEGEEDDLSQY